MNEWSVVVVLISLFGLGAAIVRPVVSLTRSITTLTVVAEDLKEDMKRFGTKNSESHERLWKHTEQQDARLEDHEKRISQIEGKR